MLWSQARLMVFDTETTGTDPHNDRVIELGAAYFERGARTELRRTLLNPECPIPAEASQIHGIHDADVASQPKVRDVGARFVAHFDGSVLGGHPPILAGYNAVSFDVPVINAELERSGFSYRIDPTTVVDVMIFVRWHHRALRSRRLEAMCAHYGVDLRNAHSAAADAAATGALLLAMVEAQHIPQDSQAALQAQARYAQVLEEEWGRWSYWLYADRGSGELRIGAGKYCGQALSQIDVGYLRYLLNKVDDLPEDVATAFRSQAG